MEGGRGLNGTEGTEITPPAL
eukprot:COSAG02_NODE_59252_length_275_cov_0.363636_1_plen_20_part_10